MLSLFLMFVLVGNPGYDPSMCAGCASVEVQCESDCGDVRDVGYMLCVGASDPLRCRDIVDNEYGRCIDNCGTVADYCFMVNNCPWVQ